MVAGTPLIVGALFGAGPDIIGLIMAAQGSAWLFVSQPAGVMVDRVAPLDAMKCGMVLAVGGVLSAMAGRWLQSLPLFAFGTFISASAAVVGFLAESASVQAIVPGAPLPSANARLQLVQSAAMLIGPLAMGYAVLQGWTMAAYALALVLAACGLALALGSDPQTPRAPRQRQPLTEMADASASCAASRSCSESLPAPCSGTRLSLSSWRSTYPSPSAPSVSMPPRPAAPRRQWASARWPQPSWRHGPCAGSVRGRS
jgi:MFS family permease